MKTTTLERSTEPASASSVATMTAPTVQQSLPSDSSTGKAAVLVGLCFLAATFTFAIGNALIRSHFSSAAAHNALVVGVFLLGCCGLSVAANGAAMRRVLSPLTPIRSRAYFVLRMTECLTLLGVGVYFLSGHAQWNAYVLAVYAVSGAAGLVLSSALLTSRIVPRSLSILGVIGYPVFLVGSISAMFNVIDITHGAGMAALVLGGLFELILPIWLFTKGFTFPQIEG
jgi:Domain of unknown function (DUF4386)